MDALQRKRYFKNLRTALSQLFNAVLGGCPDETFSSRLGRIKKFYGGNIPWRQYPGMKLIDFLLELREPGHSIVGIETDEFPQIKKESLKDGDISTN